MSEPSQNPETPKTPRVLKKPKVVYSVTICDEVGTYDGFPCR